MTTHCVTSIWSCGSPWFAIVYAAERRGEQLQCDADCDNKKVEPFLAKSATTVVAGRGKKNAV